MSCAQTGIARIDWPGPPVLVYSNHAATHIKSFQDPRKWRRVILLDSIILEETRVLNRPLCIWELAIPSEVWHYV